MVMNESLCLKDLLRLVTYKNKMFYRLEKYPTIITKKPCYINLASKKTKGVRDMFKKIGLTAVLSVAMLFGGVITTSAASVSDQSSNLTYKTQAYYLVNGKWQQVSGDSFSKFFIRCLPGFQLNWNNKQDVNKPGKNQEQQKEETKEDTVEDTVEKPKEDPKEDQNEQIEQPSEQPEEKPEAQPEERPEASTPNEQTTEKPAENEQNQVNYQLSQYEQQVVDLTNEERAKYGLSPLQIDRELSRVAREKSNDMAKNGYFSHNSPVYGSPFDMMKNYGITYRTAGENIAKGQRTPEEVVNAWMNSSGHRANILNGDFTHIGVGFVEQGNHWTQQFIGK